MIKEIKKLFLKNKTEIVKEIIENKAFNGDDFTFEDLMFALNKVATVQSKQGNVIEHIENENKIIEKINTKCGQIGIVCEHNNVLNIIYTLFMALNEGNSVKINIEDVKNYHLLQYFVDLFSVLSHKKKQHISLSFEINDEFVKKIACIDKLFIVGSRAYFNKISPSTTLPYVYYPFNNFTVIIDSLDYVEEYKKMPKSYHFYSTVKVVGLDYIKINTIKDAVLLIEGVETNYATVLFTKNKEAEMYFLENCKSDFLFINTLTQMVYLPNANQNDFLHIKTIEKLKNN